MPGTVISFISLKSNNILHSSELPFIIFNYIMGNSFLQCALSEIDGGSFGNTLGKGNCKLPS